MTMFDRSAAAEARAAQDDRDRVLAVYVLVDISGSLKQFVDALRRGLKELHDAFVENLELGQLARVSILTFNHEARVALELTDLSGTTVPPLEIGGKTDFGAAFALLKRTIEADQLNLKVDGVARLRSVVFILTDGRHNALSPWEPAWAALTEAGFAERPNIVAFGCGAADEQTIRSMATVAAFMADDGVSKAEAIGRIMSRITQSVLNTAGAARNREPRFVIPGEMPGLRRIPLPGETGAVREVPLAILED